MGIVAYRKGNLVDAFLCVCLAAHIHGTDDEVRRTVRRCQKQLPFHDARKLDVYLMTLMILK